jgi:PAS domain S-box-containing protein
MTASPHAEACPSRSSAGSAPTATLQREYLRRLYDAAAVVGLFGAATAVFVVDTIFSRTIAVAAMYVVIILVSTLIGNRKITWAISIYSIVLCTAMLILALQDQSVEKAFGKTVFRIVALVASTLIVLHNLKAEKRLRDQSRALEQAHDSVTIRALDGHYIYWNQSACRMYGWSGPEAIGRRTDEIFGDEIAAEYEKVRVYLAEHGYCEAETTRRTKSGDELVVSARYSLLYDNDRVSSVLETSNDITDKRRSDAARLLSEAKYTKLFATTLVAILECDFSRVSGGDISSGRSVDHLIRSRLEKISIENLNQASLSLFGASERGELIGPLGRIWPEGSEKVFAGALEAASNGKKSFEARVVLRKLDGSSIVVLFAATFPAGGLASGMVFLFANDITAMSLAQAELHATQINLAHATRLTSLGQLTAAITHEINQPLAGVVAHGQAGLRWLNRANPDLPAVEASLRSLVGEARRASDLVKRFTALARNGQPQRADLDVNSLVRETAHLLSADLKHNEVALQLSLDPGVAHVLADGVQIQQVLINLVINGIQAMKQTGAEQQSLLIATATSGDYVEVSVADSGKGLDPDLLARLFTPFVTTKADGMGLGLSVSRKIVEAHQGRIWADPTESLGTTFRFTLPAHAPREAQGEGKSDSPEPNLAMAPTSSTSQTGRPGEWLH